MLPFQKILLDLVAWILLLDLVLAHDLNFLYPTSPGTYNYYDNINITWTASDEDSELYVYDMSCANTQSLDKCLLTAHSLSQNGWWLMAINSAIGSHVPSYPFILRFLGLPRSSTSTYWGQVCTVTSINAAATTWGMLAIVAESATIQPNPMSATITAQSAAASTTECSISTTKQNSHEQNPTIITIVSSIGSAPSLLPDPVTSNPASPPFSTPITVSIPVISAAPDSSIPSVTDLTTKFLSTTQPSFSSRSALATPSRHSDLPGQTTNVSLYPTTQSSITVSPTASIPVAVPEASADSSKRDGLIFLAVFLAVFALVGPFWILVRKWRASKSDRISQAVSELDSPPDLRELDVNFDGYEVEGQLGGYELDGRSVRPRTGQQTLASEGSGGPAVSPLSGLENYVAMLQAFLSRTKSQSTTSRKSEEQISRPTTSRFFENSKPRPASSKYST